MSIKKSQAILKCFISRIAFGSAGLKKRNHVSRLLVKVFKTLNDRQFKKET